MIAVGATLVFLGLLGICLTVTTLAMKAAAEITRALARWRRRRRAA